MQENKYSWEVNEINLNLRTYNGTPSDVIKKIKLDIEKYLSNAEVSEKTKEIYSAIYCALDYYKTISYMPSPEFSTDETFLSYSINTFNDDFKYLTEKYGSKDPNDLPVIQLSARIKSPLGFVDKVKEKIDEYVKENRDLSYFTESLRDLMGVRVVVNPPSKIQKQGLNAESDFLYQIVYDLMDKHGIHRNQDSSQDSDFKFLPINTRHNPTKLDSIKRRPAEKGFTNVIKSRIVQLFIPHKRIPEIEENSFIDCVLKDYNRWPKFSGYQSIHFCAVPHFAQYSQLPKLPPCILPQAINDFTIEYQFRTKKQHDFAEHGPASHKFSYKPNGNRYHRLAVPFYIDFDNPSEMANTRFSDENILGPRSLNHSKLRLRNFAESYERFYGHSFKDKFNIDFEEFRDRFSSKDRNDVLAGLKIVEYNPETQTYYLVDAPKEIYIDEIEKSALEEISGIKNIDIMKLFDKHGISDGMLRVSPCEETQAVSSPNIKINLIENSSQKQTNISAKEMTYKSSEETSVTSGTHTDSEEPEI